MHRLAGRILGVLVSAWALVGSHRLAAGGSVRVGTYLYANPADADSYPGDLTVRFAAPAHRLVIAYGRQYRKDRRERRGTTEAERERFKPYLAKRTGNGVYRFAHLPMDYYDLVVVEPVSMRLYEGLSLQRGATEKDGKNSIPANIQATFARPKDRIGGWEAFFDTKRIERFETDGARGAVLIQQMRLGRALAESGAVLKGCIHSIDICWLAKTRDASGKWEILSRQQLYRGELPARKFFDSHFVSALQGIRVGDTPRTIGPLALQQ